VNRGGEPAKIAIGLLKLTVPIGDIRGETPGTYDGPWVPWPDDQTLMSQGHEVCIIALFGLRGATTGEENYLEAIASL